MREGRKEVLQVEEIICYFYSAPMKQGFMDHLSREGKVCQVLFQVKGKLFFFFIVTNCHSSKSMIKINKLHS